MRYQLYAPGTRKGYRRWYVRWSHNGRAYEAPLEAKTRAAATKEAEQYIAGVKGRPAGAPVSFEYAAQAYMAFRKPRKDDEKWIWRLVRYMGSRDVRDIKSDDIRRAADALCPHVQPETKVRYVYTPASAILHYAAEQDWCSYRRIRRPSYSRRSKRTPASESAMRMLLANTAGHQHLLLGWLYETGQRVSDSLRLMRSDLDLGRALARVGSSKTDDRGELGLSPELIAMLANAPHLPNGRVFPWGDRHNVYRWLRPLCAKLGVSYTPHQSRHAMATDLRALGYDMRAIAERGLWRDERSAGRYVHHRSTAVGERGVVLLLKGKK
jgi:integrase